MSWKNILKNDLDIYEQALKIKELIEQAREDLYSNIEPAVKGMIDAGLDEKFARQTANSLIAPMLKDLEIRDKDIEGHLKAILDEQKR